METIQRRRFLAHSGLALGATALSPSAWTSSHGKRPRNVVVILVDDMGWTDVGCYGAQLYETPNIDRLAAEGMRFSDGYAACTVCSPTRASLLTGLYPARLHITDWIAGHNKPYARFLPPKFNLQLPHERLTIAEALKPKGYATTSIGKWHLGGEEYYPETQGFDYNIGGTHRGQPPGYFAPYGIPTLEEGPEGEFLTDRMAAEAVSFMEANRENPFLVYLPLFAVHTPIQSRPEKTRKYEERIQAGYDQKHAAYAGMIESVDEAVGTILDSINRMGLEDDTLVIFTSDNGGHMMWGISSNYPLREGKGSSYEGGIRVPLIMKCPGLIEPGTECSEPVISADLMPTILDTLGVNAPEGHHFDGESLLHLMTRSGDLQRDSIFWHYPHYHPGGATPHSAIRSGDWKLIEFYDSPRLELYNLRVDIGESYNKSEIEPGIRNRLHQELIAWLKDTDAQMPIPNPEFDPNRDHLWNR